MRPTQHTLGGAILYALVFAALLGLTGLAILTTQNRSKHNTSTITTRALERATADAAVEHGKALLQQAIGAHRPLEQLADLSITNDLNNLEYELDLSLAPYGDVRADLIDTHEWAAARLNPLTGEPERHLTSNLNIDTLTLHGEWRDALVHQPTGTDPNILGIHQENVFIKPALDDGPPILQAFPDSNAPPAQIAARGTTTGPRTEVGILLDAAGRVWEWPLDIADSTPPEQLSNLTNVISISAGDRFALALTQNGRIYAWGQNPRGPLTPNRSLMNETLLEPTPLELPTRDGMTPTLLTAAAGNNHIVALDTLGNVWTWGSNQNHQAGRSCPTACPADTLNIATTSQIVSVSAGGDRSAALTQNGHLYLWGEGKPPRALTDTNDILTRVSHYSLGKTQSLAITTDGKLITFTTNTATPLELNTDVLDHKGRPKGNQTTVTRADLLRAGTTYHAAIVGSSLFTWPADTTTATRQAPPQEPRYLNHDTLENVQVTPGNTTLTITWNEPDDQDLTYQIHHSHTARDWTLASTTTSPHYHLNDLTNGQPHYLRITATDAYGNLQHEHESGPHIPAGPPNTPTNGRTTSLHQALELAWDAPANNGNPITHYRVEQSTNGVVWQTLPYEPTEPMMRVTGLENTRSYHHRVSAINNAGSSSPLTLPIGAPQGPPAPPEVQSASGHTLGDQPAITLTWSPTPGATSYRATYDLGASASSMTAQGDDTSLTITNLQANATYKLHLVAINQHGESKPSPTVRITTNAAPSAPRDLTAIPRSTTEGLIAWNPPTSGGPVTAYLLERRDEDSTWRNISTQVGETHTDTNLQPGRVYQYRVTAKNSIGVGAYTTPVELITALTPPSQPDAPTLLFRNQDSLTLNWRTPTHTGGAPTLTYQLERREQNTNTWVNLTAQHDTTTYTDTTAQPGYTYAYRVTARNQQHDSEPSDEALITATAALTAPEKPRISSREHLSITLEWNTSTTLTVTTYVLERAEKNAPFTLLATPPAQPGGTQAYTDSRVTAGNTYAYRVRSRTPKGDSDPSPPSDDIIALARSGAPRHLTAAFDPHTPQGAMRLEWVAPSDPGGSQVLGYRLQRNTNDQGWVTLRDQQNATTTATDPSAQHGDTHSYRVATITALGVDHLSPYSAPTPPQLLVTTPSAAEAPDVAPDFVNAPSPRVTWLAPYDGATPITSYTVERDAGDGWHAHATLDGTTTYYVDHTTQPGNAYRYRITATNIVGSSSPSAPSTPYEAHPTLNPPSRPNAKPSGVASIRLTWTNPEGVDPNEVQGYRLERRADNGDWATIVTHTGPGVLTRDDPALNIGTTYQYRIATINPAGVTGQPSAPSDTITASDTPTAPAPPTPTTELGKVLLTWPAPASPHAPITAYRLQRRANVHDSAWGAWSTIAQPPDRTHTDTNLARATTYQYRVIAANSAGDSQPSAASNPVTPELPPPK